jgi:transposase
MLRKSELCELLGQRTGKWVSRTALCRYLQKLGLNRKKKHGTVAFAGTERVQKLRVEYWEKIRNIEAQNKRIFRRNRDNAGFG